MHFIRDYSCHSWFNKIVYYVLFEGFAFVSPMFSRSFAPYSQAQNFSERKRDKIPL
jgi:hypothetical protein